MTLRRLYECIAVPSLTYGCAALRTLRLRRLLLKTKKIIIMVNKAYRTISYVASLIIAGVIPIDLLVQQRLNICEDISKEIRTSESKRARRRETLDSWQRRWDDSTKDRTTYEFIANIWERIDPVSYTHLDVYKRQN